MNRDLVSFVGYQLATFIMGVVFVLAMLALCVTSGSVLSLFTNPEGILLLLLGGCLGWLFFGGAKSLDEGEKE